MVKISASLLSARDNLEKTIEEINNLDIDLISITADSIYRLGVARKNLDEHGEVIADFNGKLTKSP